MSASVVSPFQRLGAPVGTSSSAGTPVFSPAAQTAVTPATTSTTTQVLSVPVSNTEVSVSTTVSSVHATSHLGIDDFFSQIAAPAQAQDTSASINNTPTTSSGISEPTPLADGLFNFEPKTPVISPAETPTTSTVSTPATPSLFASVPSEAVQTPVSLLEHTVTEVPSDSVTTSTTSASVSLFGAVASAAHKENTELSVDHTPSPATTEAVPSLFGAKKSEETPTEVPTETTQTTQTEAVSDQTYSQTSVATEETTPLDTSNTIELNALESDGETLVWVDDAPIESMNGTSTETNTSSVQNTSEAIINTPSAPATRRIMASSSCSAEVAQELESALAEVQDALSEPARLSEVSGTVGRSFRRLAASFVLAACCFMASAAAVMALSSDGTSFAFGKNTADIVSGLIKKTRTYSVSEGVLR